MVDPLSLVRLRNFISLEVRPLTERTTVFSFLRYIPITLPGLYSLSFFGGGEGGSVSTRKPRPQWAFDLSVVGTGRLQSQDFLFIDEDLSSGFRLSLSFFFGRPRRE